MKTLNEVLHFLNKLDLVAKLERDDFKNFNCNKKVLANDLHTENLINMLNAVDDILILFVTHDFQIVRVLTDVLRDDIFPLFNVKIENEYSANI